MNYFRTNLLIAMVAISILALLGPSPARASSDITFLHEGTARNGFSLGGEIFLGQYDFIITAFGDVGDREEFVFGYIIEHQLAMMEIVGVGTFQILTPTQTGVNNIAGRIGFTRADGAEAALVTGPTNPLFLDWDMTTSIGPIAGNDGRLIQWNQEPFIETTGGRLIFDDEENVFVRFTAEVIVPGPAPMALFPLAALLCPRRRRRSA